MSCTVSIDLKPIELPSLSDFGDLLIFINNHLKDSDRVITRIILNGDEVDEDKEHELLGYTLKDEDYIEFYSAKPIDLAIESFTYYCDLLLATVSDLKTGISKMRSGEEKTGFDFLSDSLDLFHLFNAVAQHVDFQFFNAEDSHRSDYKTFDTLNLLPNKLKDLTEAIESQDTITTADLIEDDLIPIIQLCADEAPLILKTLKELRDKN